jgi:signal peptidase I
MKTDSRVASSVKDTLKGPEDGIFQTKDDKPSTTNNWVAIILEPIYIPQAGKTVTLNKTSLSLYKIIIGEAEK